MFLLDTLTLKWSDTQAKFFSAGFLCLEEGGQGYKNRERGDGVTRNEGKTGWKVWGSTEF